MTTAETCEGSVVFGSSEGSDLRLVDVRASEHSLDDRPGLRARRSDCVRLKNHMVSPWPGTISWKGSLEGSSAAS